MALFSWMVQSSLLDYALSAIAVLTVALFGGIYAFQNKLIYVPNFPPGSRKEVWKPDRFGMSNFESVTLTSSDGVKLQAYWIPCPPRKASFFSGNTKNDVYTVLFFHANAGNMGHRLPILKRISELADNVNFLIISYRGYGQSEGVPHEAGIRKDAQAALDHVLNERAAEINNDRIIVYGQSIGGAVAIDLAARNTSKVSAIIVENTFQSLPKLIPDVMPIIGWAKGLCHEIWDSEARLKEMVNNEATPKVLLLSGSRDELVPPYHMEKLYRILIDSPSSTLDSDKKVHEKEGIKMVKFAKGSHNDTCLQNGYFEAIVEFIKSIN